MKHLSLLMISVLMTASISIAHAQIRITDTSKYDTATQMLLANEINESGEPYAEAIGYDLDALDPMVPGFPDQTAYALGIENYEYSRYQLGVIIARSGMGLHMMWSPLIVAQSAMVGPDFDGSQTMAPNGYNEDDMLMMAIMHFGHLANQTPPMNAWPQFGEFVGGDPHYAQPVDADNFQMDFASLRWDRQTMDKRLSPGALGQSLMKQYLWAQDMLGGFHDGDEGEVVPDGVVSPDFPDGTFDPENDVFFGGDNLDGFVGQVLTAEGINKVKHLLENMAYDGTALGGVDPMTYDPANGLRYFPHMISVTEEMVPGLPPRVGSLTVDDPASDLFDQASMLWGTLSFKNMMDPDNNSDEAHLAYHSVFDGDPFPAAMATTGTPGPFDLMKGASRVIFLNMTAMHFDHMAGTFVDRNAPDEYGVMVMGNHISAVNAAYAIVALGVLQEEFAGTPMADMAGHLIREQADFMIDRMGDRNHLFADRVNVKGQGQGGRRTVEAQAAAVRGLYAAYSSTGDMTYAQAADEAYMALVDQYYREGQGAFATNLNSPKATYTPRVAALLSGALREARLVGGHTDATSIYVDFWDNVVNKMQLAEGMATGETGSDSDHDGIPFIPQQAAGLAPVFAPQGTMKLVEEESLAFGADDLNDKAAGSVTVLHQNDPNPFNPMTEIRFDLARAGHVKLAVYDLRGNLVKTLVSRNMGAGAHEAIFQGEDVASGVYYYVLNTDQGRNVGKMTLLK
jgi:hypothetical protein